MKYVISEYIDIIYDIPLILLMETIPCIQQSYMIVVYCDYEC